MTFSVEHSSETERPDALETRLRRDADFARREPPASIRSAVMQRIVAGEANSTPSILARWRAQALAAPVFAIAASLVIFAGVWFVQPPMAASPDKPAAGSTLQLFQEARSRAEGAPSRIVESTLVSTLESEYERLRTDADRAAAMLRSALSPIRSALFSQ